MAFLKKIKKLSSKILRHTAGALAGMVIGAVTYPVIFLISFVKKEESRKPVTAFACSLVIAPLIAVIGLIWGGYRGAAHGLKAGLSCPVRFWKFHNEPGQHHFTSSESSTSSSEEDLLDSKQLKEPLNGSYKLFSDEIPLPQTTLSNNATSASSTEYHPVHATKPIPTSSYLAPVPITVAAAPQVSFKH